MHAQAQFNAAFHVLKNGTAIGSAYISVSRDEDGLRTEATFTDFTCLYHTEARRENLSRAGLTGRPRRSLCAHAVILRACSVAPLLRVQKMRNL